jgi:Tol biopolymer transport system component
VDGQGRQTDDESFGVALSPDGGSVAFGNAAALVPEDTNGKWDVYVRDDGTGTTVSVDVGADGKPTGGRLVYTRAAIGDQGRFVAFVSESRNLVPGDTNGVADVFVLDRSLGTIERVSVASGGGQSNGDSGLYAPAVTPDGRYVAFASLASNLVPGDTNGTWDVFVRDRVRGTTERVSVGAGGEQAKGNSSGAPALSADGRFVAFQSFASNLVPGDTNGATDVFVRDRTAGTTERVSVATGGGQGDGQSGESTISADGQLVAFDSQASDLVPGDTNAATDVFVHDRRTGSTTLVSTGWRW